MEIKKSYLSEAMNLEKGKETFSEKPQNIIMTESQFERLIEKINTEK
jgi:hypothetical protein